MKHLAAVALAGLGLLCASPSRAHVYYLDLNQGDVLYDLTAAGKLLVGNNLPISDPAYWNNTYQVTSTLGETWTSAGGSYASGTWSRSVHLDTLDSSSWTDGMRIDDTQSGNLLGESHSVNFANFHLDQTSRVSISVSDELAGSGYGLNPSFTLYRGLMVYGGHDDDAVDPLNPKSGVPPKKVQNAVDTGTVTDSQGILSAYRNTFDNAGTYIGQFNALGSWSMSNDAGDWSALKYLTHATGTVNPDGTWAGNANVNALTDYLLPAGDYTIIFGGNAQPMSYATTRSATATSEYKVVTGNGVDLSFSAVAAPVPEADTWALLLTGLGLVVLAIRRRP